MGLSFRKSITILPGVKLNISKSGVGVSAGVPGLRASINSKGQLRGTAGIPGSGLRYTKSRKLSDLLPGAAARAEEKKAQLKAEKDAARAAAKAEKDAAKAASKAEQDAAKAELKAAKEAQKAAEKEAAELRRALEEAESRSAAAQGEKKQAPDRNELAQAVVDIYAIADSSIDWLGIKNSSADTGYENWAYLKERADRVLEGDIDCYLEIINDINPFSELIELGSSFECGSDSPMKMSVLCTVNAGQVLGEYKNDKGLVEDYIAGTAIKSARDIFAILPVWQVEVTAVEADKTVLNVKFTRDSFEELNFERIDASDSVKKLGGIIAV